MHLDEKFWDNKYKSEDTGWDIGKIARPIKTYFDQITNKDLHILIPGGGNSYEAEYLHKKGFKNVFVVDVSQTALQNFKSRVPSFSENNLIHSNFFDLDKGFDLIIEQTFFCALNPRLRSKYAQKMNELLLKKGKLVGLLFCVPLNEDHPPFGGNKEEYLSYFDSYFDIDIMEPSHNSIPSREGNELFIKLIKK